MLLKRTWIDLDAAQWPETVPSYIGIIFIFGREGGRAGPEVYLFLLLGRGDCTLLHQETFSGVISLASYFCYQFILLGLLFK